MRSNERIPPSRRVPSHVALKHLPESVSADPLAAFADEWLPLRVFGHHSPDPA